MEVRLILKTEVQCLIFVTDEGQRASLPETVQFAAPGNGIDYPEEVSDEAHCCLDRRDRGAVLNLNFGVWHCSCI
jgi:hypothetical protein